MKTLSKLILIGSLLLSTQNLFAKDNTIVTFTSSNYLSKLLKSDKPVLVKFWASWCRPCRTMTPKFHAAAKTFKGKVTFAQVNVDEQKHVAARYQIRSLPTMILFKKDKIIARKVGSLSQKNIEAFARKAL